jgi:hypothetical protein
VVGLYLSHLYHVLFLFWGASRGYNARFSSYKEASATSRLNHNSLLVRIITTCLLFLSHNGALVCTFGVILWMLSLVLVVFS